MSLHMGAHAEGRARSSSLSLVFFSGSHVALIRPQRGAVPRPLPVDSLRGSLRHPPCSTAVCAKAQFP